MAKKDEMKDVHQGAGWGRQSLKDFVKELDAQPPYNPNDPDNSPLSKRDQDKDTDPDSVWHTHFNRKLK